MTSKTTPERFAQRIVASTPPVLERDVEKYFCEQVKALGGDVRKVAWVGRRSAPDRYTLMPGVAINFWAEIKRPGYVVTPHVLAQRREHDRLRAYDEVVYVLDSFEAVDAVLAPYKRKAGK